MKPEDILTTPGAKVCVEIREKTPIGDYHDSIYYTPEAWAALKAADIIAQKQARVDNWVTFVQEQSSKPPVIPTREELLEQKAELVKRMEQLDVALAMAAVEEVEVIK